MLLIRDKFRVDLKNSKCEIFLFKPIQICPSLVLPIMTIFRTFVLCSLLLSFTTAIAYESMHEKTPVGEVKVILLPERVALEAQTEDSYFSGNNGMFRTLFRYINQNEVSMTTPVEADIQPGKMRFFVGAKDLSKKVQSTGTVKVRTLPPILVAAIGVRGGYSEKRFLDNKLKLHQWLSNNDKYEGIGKAYGVYWHGPFVPGPFKRSEVHLPIQKVKNESP